MVLACFFFYFLLFCMYVYVLVYVDAHICVVYVQMKGQPQGLPFWRQSFSLA